MDPSAGTPATKRKRVHPGIGIPVALLAGLLAYAAFQWVRPYAVIAAGTPNGCTLASAGSARGWDFAFTFWRLKQATTMAREPGTRLIVYRTPERTFWVPEAAPFLFVMTEQLLRVYGDGAYRVRPGDVVLDCGANVGTFVHEALSAGASKVIAIEPVPHNLDAMRRTFAREIATGTVVIYGKGVWDKDDVLEMTTYDNSALDSFVMPERDGHNPGGHKKVMKLPLTTIDKMVAELGLTKVDFIKMDIEGAERQALRGGTETIRKFRPRMSIALENLADDYVVLPRIVREIRGDYQQQCVRCAYLGSTGIRADVMHFN